MIAVFETVRVEDGRVRLRERHLERLARAGAPPARVADAAAILDEAVLLTDQPFVLRIDVDDAGAVPSTRPVPPTAPVDLPLHVSYDPALDARLAKGADRAWAEAAEREAGGEPLLVTVDGRVGETTRAAVITVDRDGAWRVPRLEGILPGVTRAWAIERTGAVEAELGLADLRAAAGAALLTAARGVVPIASIAGEPLRRSPLVDALGRDWEALP
ncbi:MAG: aminotransferase class IV [Actinomycetota bacterium]